jgi:hypothetical protein
MREEVSSDKHPVTGIVQQEPETGNMELVTGLMRLKMPFYRKSEE